MRQPPISRSHFQESEAARLYYSADVSDAEQAQAAMQACIAKLGRAGPRGGRRRRRCPRLFGEHSLEAHNDPMASIIRLALCCSVAALHRHARAPEGTHRLHLYQARG